MAAVWRRARLRELTWVAAQGQRAAAALALDFAALATPEGDAKSHLQFAVFLDGLYEDARGRCAQGRAGVTMCCPRAAQAVAGKFDRARESATVHADAPARPRQRQAAGLGDDAPAPPLLLSDEPTCYVDHLPAALTHYFQAAIKGPRHVYAALPRLLTLYCEFGSDAATAGEARSGGKSGDAKLAKFVREKLVEAAPTVRRDLKGRGEKGLRGGSGRIRCARAASGGLGSCAQLRWRVWRCSAVACALLPLRACSSPRPQLRTRKV